MTSGIWVAAIAVLGAIGVGCGSNATIDDGGEGGSGNAGGSGAAGATGGNGGKGGECTAYADEPSLGSVTIRFVNDSGLPIYLPASCSTPGFELLPIEGEDGTAYHYDPSCLQTCETLQSEDPFFCGACAPTSFLIEPGESLEVAWNGLRLDGGVDMPDACWKSTEFNDSCAQLLTAAAGEYRIVANGFAGCTGECTCTEEGQCDGEAGGQEAFADPTTFTFPGDTTVDVVFGPCAFPCPG